MPKINLLMMMELPRKFSSQRNTTVNQILMPYLAEMRPGWLSKTLTPQLTQEHVPALHLYMLGGLLVQIAQTCERLHQDHYYLW